jgi:hypothetical protein
MTADYTERTPIDAAQDDLTRIDETIARLQEERAKVVAFIEMYGKYAKPLPMSSGAVMIQPFGGMAPIDRQPLNIRIGNFVEAWMSGEDEPCAIGEIFEMLTKNNLVPGGKDPKQAVSAILGKDKRFQYKAGEGWSRVPRVQHTPREQY